MREFTTLDEGLLCQIGRLRVEAWQTEVARAGEMPTWLDDCDQTAHHWVVFREDIPIAAARLSIHRSLAEVPDAESYVGLFADLPVAPIASLNRLVVHPSARGAGLSKQLDLVRLAAAERVGCRSVIVSTASGPRRVGQLMALGFAVVGIGPRFLRPPLCHMPPPVVLLCRLPRVRARTEVG